MTRKWGGEFLLDLSIFFLCEHVPNDCRYCIYGLSPSSFVCFLRAAGAEKAKASSAEGGGLVELDCLGLEGGGGAMKAERADGGA